MLYIPYFIGCKEWILIGCLRYQTACQDADDDDRDDEEAEFDMMLVENAGEVIPSVAKVIGGQAFAPFFAGLLPELLKRVVSDETLKSYTINTSSSE